MPMPEYLNNPLFHVGLGLMSVPNQSYLPGAVSWGPGIQRGLLGYQQSLLYQNEEEERRQRQEMQQRKMQWEMQQQQAAQEAAAQQAQAYEQYLATQSPEMQTYGRAFGQDATAKIAARQFEDPNEAKSLEQLWLTDPKRAAELEAQRVAIRGKAGTSVSQTVRLPNVEKPVGKDAVHFRLPDGSVPPVNMTPNQIAAAGGYAVSAAQKSKEKVAGDIQEKEKQYTRRVGVAQSAYDEAKSDFAERPSAATKRALDAAAHNLKVALAQQANIAGEPSDFVARGQVAPGAIGGLLDQFVLDPALRALQGRPKEGPLPTQPLPPVMTHEELMRRAGGEL